MTYPASANSDVEDDEHGIVAERLPDFLVPDLGSSDGVVDVAVHGPLDRLLLPVVWGTVPFQSPGLVPVAGHVDGGSEP